MKIAGARMEFPFWIFHMSIFLTSFTAVVADCPESGSCESCDLVMSVNLESVNNVITITQQDKVTFTLNFQHQGHNGFTFVVNDKVFNANVRNPDFPCTSEPDTPDVTQTLEVQYHCTAVNPGSYRIEAYVYCGNDEYFAQTFTVIVENAALATLGLPTSSTVLPSMMSSLVPSATPPTTSSVPSPTMAIIPSNSSSSTPTSTSTSVLPPSTTRNNMPSDPEGDDTLIVLICVFAALFALAVILIIILLLICIKRRPKNVLCRRSKQLTPDQSGDDCQMQQTQYGSNTAISETASHGTSDSQVAASDYPTPVESVTVSLTQLEQIDMWEPITQQPDDARTPHQLVDNQRDVSTD